MPLTIEQIRERARAALAAQPAPAAPEPEPGVDWEAIVEAQIARLHQGMMTPLKRSHPIGRKDRRAWSDRQPGKPAHPRCNLSDRPQELPTVDDLEAASGQVLRLYQDGGGRLRRHLADQEAQEQADSEQQAQTPEQPVQAGLPGQEGHDGQDVDGRATGGPAPAVPSYPALDPEHRADQ
ncbi:MULTISPECIES: hypothetical protein [Cyanophyceae]|uniref:Uncharacterized protein n=1 Tax=Leptolyngbya subtilissima DQ-A4 TaxID=2933933 RepID=A0ABV0KCF5_9CYAN|nr:hypothetical protein [Nodosilinea sp. FACHB-141]MBD2115252.1 hypothetical protein [Nodosilinea sp. FACHB-141]